MSQLVVNNFTAVSPRKQQDYQLYSNWNTFHTQNLKALSTVGISEPPPNETIEESSEASTDFHRNQFSQVLSDVDEDMSAVSIASLTTCLVDPNPLQTPSPDSYSAWEQAVNFPIISVRCNKTMGQLHKLKFLNGKKGKCIKQGQNWFTPREFERCYGRENFKDWKKNIRFEGRSLHTVIKKGYLLHHNKYCTCLNCAEDEIETDTSFGSSYRKRKAQDPAEVEATTHKLTSSTFNDSNEITTDASVGTSSSSVKKHESKKQNNIIEYLMRLDNWKKTHDSLPTTKEEWKILEHGIVTPKLPDIQTWKETAKKRMKEQRVIARRNELKRFAQNSEQLQLKMQMKYNNSNFNRSRMYSTPRPGTSQSTEGQESYCNNCNKKGSFKRKCTICHTVNYCTLYCQKKDWEYHKLECN